MDITAFSGHAVELPTLVGQLLAVEPFRYSDRPKGVSRAGGVYLFTEGGKHLYSGRTRDIRRRLGDHCNASSGHNAAPFAFLLAREATGWTKAEYAQGGRTRKALMGDFLFCSAFECAKERIATMDIRYVVETDPVRQALLEIYAAVVLDCRYNDFDTH